MLLLLPRVSIGIPARTITIIASRSNCRRSSNTAGTSGLQEQRGEAGGGREQAPSIPERAVPTRARGGGRGHDAGARQADSTHTLPEKGN